MVLETDEQWSIERNEMIGDEHTPEVLQHAFLDFLSYHNLNNVAQPIQT